MVLLSKLKNHLNNSEDLETKNTKSMLIQSTIFLIKSPSSILHLLMFKDLTSSA